jgi:hypothetical protein
MIRGLAGLLAIIAGSILFYLYRRTWRSIPTMSEEEYEESYYDIIYTQEILMMSSAILWLVGIVLLLWPYLNSL